MPHGERKIEERKGERKCTEKKQKIKFLNERTSLLDVRTWINAVILAIFYDTDRDSGE